MNSLITRFLSVAVVALLPTSSRATTYLAGSLPDTLRLADSPFVVLSEIWAGDSTVVEAGVEVNFTEGTALTLSDSYFRVEGTEGSRVVFQGWSGASWRGIGDQANRLNTLLIDLNWLHMTGAQRGFEIDSYLGGSVIHVNHCSIDAVQQDLCIRIAGSAGVDLLIENTTTSNGAYGVAIDVPASRIVSSQATNCTEGFKLYRSVSCDGLVASGCAFGMVLDPGATTSPIQISNCQFSGNETGMLIWGTPWAVPSITNSTLTNNSTYGVDLQGQTPAEFHGCVLHDNGVYDVRVMTSVQAYPTIDMQNCYWGAATTAEMQAEGTFSDIAAISDWWDNHQYSLVNYEGFISSTSAQSFLETATWGAVKARYR